MLPLLILENFYNVLSKSKTPFKASHLKMLQIVDTFSNLHHQFLTCFIITFLIYFQNQPSSLSKILYSKKFLFVSMLDESSKKIILTLSKDHYTIYMTKKYFWSYKCNWRILCQNLVSMKNNSFHKNY